MSWEDYYGQYFAHFSAFIVWKSRNRSLSYNDVENSFKGKIIKKIIPSLNFICGWFSPSGGRGTEGAPVISHARMLWEKRMGFSFHPSTHIIASGIENFFKAKATNSNINNGPILTRFFAVYFTNPRNELSVLFPCTQAAQIHVWAQTQRQVPVSFAVGSRGRTVSMDWLVCSQ